MNIMFFSENKENSNFEKIDTVKDQCRKETGYVENNRRELSDYINSQLLENKDNSIISDFNILREEVNNIRMSLQQTDNDLNNIDHQGD